MGFSKGFLVSPYKDTLAISLTKTPKLLRLPKNILVDLDFLFFFGVEKKFGYSFDVKICNLSMRFPACLDTLAAPKT